MTTGVHPAVSPRPASTTPDGRRGGGKPTAFLIFALPRCSLGHFVPRSLLRGLIVVGRVPLGRTARGVGCVPRADFARARVGSRRRVRVRAADAVARCRSWDPRAGTRGLGRCGERFRDTALSSTHASDKMVWAGQPPTIDERGREPTVEYAPSVRSVRPECNGG